MTHGEKRRLCTTNWSRGLVSSGATSPISRPPRASAAGDNVAAGSRPAGNFYSHRPGAAAFSANPTATTSLFIVLIYFFSTSSLFNRPVELHSPFENTKVEHYPLSEYLPPINTGPRGEAKPRKGAPKLAKQEILSVPPNPDNNHQTIVTPPKVKLDHDVPLPNIVAWTNIPGQPIAASSRQLSQLKMPQFVPAGGRADSRCFEAEIEDADACGRAANRGGAHGRCVEDEVQAADADDGAALGGGACAVARPLKLKRGEINMAQMTPQVDAPKLPVQPQRAAGVGDSAGADTAGKDVPAQPSLQGLQSSKGQGQIIALSLSPADVRGPIEVPARQSQRRISRLARRQA